MAWKVCIEGTRLEPVQAIRKGFKKGGRKGSRGEIETKKRVTLRVWCELTRGEAKKSRQGKKSIKQQGVVGTIISGKRWDPKTVNKKGRTYREKER